MHIQANTNGRLHPATEPSLPPLNRGFLYGDAHLRGLADLSRGPFRLERALGAAGALGPRPLPDDSASGG